MKSILIVSCVFPPEPVVSANLSFDIANELSKYYKVTVVVPRPTRPYGYKHNIINKNEFTFEYQKLNSFTFPKSNFLGRFIESYSFGLAVKKYIKKNKSSIDLVYLNTWPIFGQFFVLKSTNKFKIKSITHIQDIYPETLIKRLPFLIRKLAWSLLFPIEEFIIKNSTELITISNGMRNYLVSSRNLPESKIHVIYNWQDENKILNFSKRKLIPKKEFTFMFLGSLSPSANLEMLIVAFSKLTIKNVKLIIAGQGSERINLERKIVQLNSKNIELIDAPSNNVGEIQSVADVLLLSLVPGAAKLALPSKFCSYLFSAKPILATVESESDIAKIIFDTKSGFVTEPNNEIQLLKSISQICNLNKTELEALGNNGRNFALANFSRNSNLSKISSLILESLKNGC